MGRYVSQDRKWLLFSFWCSLRIFEDSNTLFSLNKTARLSRHGFESWVCPVFKCACFDRDAYCVREKMVFIDSSTFIANIWVLKNSKMLVFKEKYAFKKTQF